MSRYSAMYFTRGIMTGAIIGATVGMAVKSMMPRPNPVRKNAEKAIKTVGSAIHKYF